MEKRNSNNNHEFNPTSPEQVLNNNIRNNDNTPASSFINNTDGIYNNSFSPEQQNNASVNNWREYRNASIVTSEMFSHGPLNHSLNNSQDFDTMYQQQQISNFQPETQFNYNHHRGSLPAIHNPNGGEHYNPPLSNLPSMINNNAPQYQRRYTEGSIPRYSRKQRMNSNSSGNSNSNKGDEDEHNLNDEEGKRKHFLERNRQAALKCRQRKKQWLNNLQHRVEFLSADNEQLQSQATMLREEVINLKTLLLAHRDCKVAQANGTTMHMIQTVSSNTLHFQNNNTSTAILPSSSSSVPNNHHIQQRFQHTID